MFKVLFLSKIYPACHLDVNGIKPGSNSIMTDKHTTEHSKTASLGIYWPVCDVYIAHTTKVARSVKKARSINILDRNANFYFTGKFSYK